VNQLTGNFDVAYNFGMGARTFTPFAGAGIGLLYTNVDNDFGDDINETDGVVNAIGGVTWNLDFLTPYAQVKYMRPFDGDLDSDLALVIGLRF
jgi:hypothetical protein